MCAREGNRTFKRTKSQMEAVDPADAFAALSLNNPTQPNDNVLLTLSALGDAVELAIRPCDHSKSEPQTLLLFDEAVCAHRHPHTDHPERPERVVEVNNALRDGGLAAHCVLGVPGRLVTKQEVALVHEARHWDRIEWAVSQEIGAIDAFVAQHESIYLNDKSLDAAARAAGAVLDLTDAVVSGRAKNGMALVRPPGHHAEAHQAMGFCVFNTTAIAARYAKEKLGCQRVLIVDWDIHHGNGIQHIFEDDPSVLYFSVHRYERGQFFPSADTFVEQYGFPNGATDGGPQNVGFGSGAGTSVNIGWNTRGSATRPGDAEYKAAWREVLMPIAREFDPSLVIIAAGFDAAEGDPLGGCHLSPAGFAELTRELMTLANGKVVLALEGGYSLSATAVSAAACMEALLGMRPSQKENVEPAPEPVKAEPPAPRRRESLRSTPERAKSATEAEKKPAQIPARLRARLEKRGSGGEGAAERFAPPSPRVLTPKNERGATMGADGVEKTARKAIDETIQIHQKYWACLREKTVRPEATATMAAPVAAAPVPAVPVAAAPVPAAQPTTPARTPKRPPRTPAAERVVVEEEEADLLAGAIASLSLAAAGGGGGAREGGRSPLAGRSDDNKPAQTTAALTTTMAAAPACGGVEPSPRTSRLRMLFSEPMSDPMEVEQGEPEPMD